MGTTSFLTGALFDQSITVDDYHRMGAAGAFADDDRFELLEGYLVRMSPIGPRHANVVDVLARGLMGATRDRGDLRVRVQNPLVVGRRSEPQPDVAIVSYPWRGFPERHPGPPDVWLVVEVADATLGLDLGRKRALYAAAGIEDYWVVDFRTNVVRVLSGPVGSGAGASYGTDVPFTEGLISVRRLGLDLDVSNLLN